MALAVVGTGLVLITFACTPSPRAAPAPPTPTDDPFVVVRATAAAAYESGRAHLDRGELEQALVDLDTAKTNDPDNRQDIQQALDATLRQLQALTPTAGPTPPPQRTIVVATVPAASPVAAAAVSAIPVVSPSASVALVKWSDPQGRFTIGAPASWTAVDQPQSFVGSPVVEFRDPTGRAEFDVTVDSSTRAVSPELYTASIELAMQQQVPGYASEQALPVTVGGTAGFERIFTFTQRDASGAEHQARGMQVVVLKSSTPYVVSATAPAELFANQYRGTFDSIVASFAFS